MSLVYNIIKGLVIFFNQTTMDILVSMTHPTEIWALMQYKFAGGRNAVLPEFDQNSLSINMQRCYQLLNQTSRSFAAVIQALDDQLRPAVCLFYLILRALDTIEDDMTIPNDVKISILKSFHTYLYDSHWRYMDSKERDRAVLEDFPQISAEFRKLEPKFQDVIRNITQKMGSGMTVFLNDQVQTMEEWDEYCHYVAGLVGIGLSQLFALSGLEEAHIGDNHQLANSMGLFLQKTNIIRDYLEDSLQNREFWPKEAWSQFVVDLKDFQQPPNHTLAVHCINMLITNTLKLVPDVLQYMSQLKNQSVFNFCAIPQTMAIATLSLCYNNEKVFKGMVKIRKGQAVQLIMQSTTMNNVYQIMAYYANEILQKIPPSDPSAEETKCIILEILSLCKANCSGLEAIQTTFLSQYKAPIISTVALIALSYVYWHTQYNE